MEYEQITYGRPDKGEPYNRRWLVRNGDIIGSYTVFFRADGSTYGASRDYHRIATHAEIEAWSAYHDFQQLDLDVQEAMEDNGVAPSYARQPHACEFHDNKPCICDGSSLVQVVTDDERCFAIAESMAQ